MLQVVSMLRGQKQLPADDEDRDGSILDYILISKNFRAKETPTVKAKNSPREQYE